MIYIYKYTNLLNNHIYIGQTINVKKRWREHLNAANNPNNKDKNTPIHAAIRKYGIDNFKIEIIDTCIDAKTANERERYWIQYYDSYHHGYNATPGGQDGGGYNGKKVEVYDLNGNYVTSYNNAKLTAAALNTTYSVVQQVLHHQRPTCKNYQLKYAEDTQIIQAFHSRQGGAIPINQLSLTGEFIKQWNSATEAARSLCLDASTITKCCKKKLKTTGGFKWAYAEDKR